MDAATMPVGDTPSVDEVKAYVTGAMADPHAGDGDCWYIIPLAFVEAIANSTDPDFAELAEKVGPVDSTDLLDPTTGEMYSADNEPVVSYAVSPEVYSKLSQWFGTVHNDGNLPVTRYLVATTDGTFTRVEIERHQPVMLVHKLASTPQRRGYQTREAKVVPFTASRTFNDLVVAVSDPDTISRVWFVPGDDRLPPQMTPRQLASYSPTLVLPSLLPQKLSAHSITGGQRYNVVVETYTTSWPMNTFLAASAPTDLDTALHQGGTLGLSNLGNTCYMNSALQCLLHIPEVCLYFLFNLHTKELNSSNPLGYNGDVARSFGSLLQQTYDKSASSHLAPRDFKSTIGRYSQMFYGYMQQDSQELLSWLLDALHEDLNRVLEKPYSEKPELDDNDVGKPEAIIELAAKCWDQYKSRNSSVITDLFTGLYQSTLVCPTCEKTSITFDPFNDITLPLPVAKKWYRTFTMVDLGDGTLFEGSPQSRVFDYEVELTKTSSVEDLRTYIATQFQISPQHLFIYEIFHNNVYKDYQTNSSQNRFLPVSSQISDDDKVVIYYIPNEDDDIIVPLTSSVAGEDPSYRTTDKFGIPLFVVLKQNEVSSFGTIYAKVWQLQQLLTSQTLPYHDYQKNRGSKRYTKADFVDDAIVVDSDGYSSDVSLADPSVNPDEFFTVKAYTTKTRAASLDNRRIFVPDHTMGQLEPLSSRLPERKRQYYYFKHEEEQPVESSEENSDYVMVDKPVRPMLSSLNPSDDDSSSEPPIGESLIDDNPNPPEATKLASDIGDSDDSPVEVSEPHKEIAHIPNVVDDDLVTRTTQLQCVWNREPFCEWMIEDTPPKMKNPSIEKSKKAYIRQRSAKITLDDCLRQFSTPEVLGEHDLWYCPNCKDHKQATKAIQLWQCGDIVTIHLKRFHQARAFADKIEMVVDFPIEGLDLGPYIAGPGDNQVYDLIGVDNHYGGLGGGHYTASAKNNRDGKWYNYNDSSVSPLEDPQSMVTGAAYLLFYRKRSETVGSVQLQQLLVDGREEFAKKLVANQEVVARVDGQIKKYDEETSTVEFTNPSEDDLYEDDTSVRKQRLLEKNENSTKVAQIIGGVERITHSPKPEEVSDNE